MKKVEAHLDPCSLALFTRGRLGLDETSKDERDDERNSTVMSENNENMCFMGAALTISGKFVRFRRTPMAVANRRRHFPIQVRAPRSGHAITHGFQEGSAHKIKQEETRKMR